MLISENSLLKEICRDSFIDFVKEFWDEVNTENLVWGWHMDVMCNTLQESAEKVFRNQTCEKDTIINISPGTSKSTICSQMYPAWIWCRFPRAQILLASYTGHISNQNSSKARDIIRSEKYQSLFEVELRKDCDGKSFFANYSGGYVYSIGIGGALTGKHGHFLIVDDPLNPKEAASDKELETANRWLSETLPSRKVNKRTTFTLMIMQRLSENDCTGFLLSRKAESVNHICLPAELTELVKPVELRDHYQNGLMDNLRLSREVLDRMRVDLGEYAYAGQFLQQPVPRTGGLFHAENFVLTPNLPEQIDKVIRYWDKAGTRDAGCYTAGVKLARLRSGAYIVLDVVRGQWEPFQRNRIMRQVAEMDGRNCTIAIEMEPGSGGKESALITVSELAGWKVEVDKPVGDKFSRAEPFSCQVNVGNVYLLKGDWNQTFLDEIRLFPNSRYKDQVDAVSAAFNLVVSTRKIDYKRMVGKVTESERREHKAVKSVNGILLP